MCMSVALLAAVYSGVHGRGNGEGGKEREAPTHSNLTPAAPRITKKLGKTSRYVAYTVS